MEGEKIPRFYGLKKKKTQGRTKGGRNTNKRGLGEAAQKNSFLAKGT